MSRLELGMVEPVVTPVGPTPPQTITRVRVRYAETDKMGVVYYANYLVWFEVGRCDLLRDLGSSYRSLEGEGIHLPVIEASCEYLQPTRYDDELTVRTTGRLLSPVRVAFDYVVTRVADAVVAATGRTVHASVNPEGRPCRLPAHFREYFA